MNKRTLGCMAAFMLLLSSCSVMPKTDPEADARKFLSKFSSRLSSPDDAMSDLFDSRQSRESVSTIVGILKNTAHEFIRCTSGFESAVITQRDEGMFVQVPVKFVSVDLEKEYRGEAMLSFLLKPDNNDLIISRVDGDEFYKAFAIIKNEMKWFVERETEYRKREPMYASAAAIQQNFDSVIWFTEYKERAFFYVVNGTWVNYFQHYQATNPNKDHSMGLVDEDGTIVIPAEYELIGTPGFSFENIVEVSRDGKYGYFDIAKRREIVPVEYDVVIPHGPDEIFCFVRKDSVYGYFDNQYVYHDGFQNPVQERWVREFAFLPKSLKLDAGYQALCEIPSRDHAGYGIVIPPSYLVRTGIFEPIVGNISSTNFPMMGWTDYVESEGTRVAGVTETLSALITTIKERFLDGREEFYRHDKITFVSPSMDTLAVSMVGGTGEVSFRILDSLLEVRHYSDDEGYFEESYAPDIVPAYLYFLMGENLSLTALKSIRMFPQTEFVYLDSSYFAGKFKHFGILEEDGEQVHRYYEIDFLSRETIAFMRDEILAAHGYKFPDEERNGWFYQYRDLPRRELAEIYDLLTDIDRHNLQFLESLLLSNDAIAKTF